MRTATPQSRVRGELPPPLLGNSMSNARQAIFFDRVPPGLMSSLGHGGNDLKSFPQISSVRGQNIAVRFGILLPEPSQELPSQHAQSRSEEHTSELQSHSDLV